MAVGSKPGKSLSFSFFSIFSQRCIKFSGVSSLHGSYVFMYPALYVKKLY